MHPRLFTARSVHPDYDLVSSITWHTCLTPSLRDQIIKITVDSFLDAYRGLSEEKLGLRAGLTKKQWLTDMIISELNDFEKGKYSLATISLDDQAVGFIMCSAPKARHADLKVDLYIDLLAVKPFRDFYSGEKIQLGLGRQIMESVITRFDSANCINLDTRVLNTPAQAFYTKLGFSCTGAFTFGGYDPKHYTGFEKSVMRRNTV